MEGEAIRVEMSKALPSVEWLVIALAAIVGCASLDVSVSKTDSAMVEIATEIRDLPRSTGADAAKLDARVDQLTASARRAWEASPSRSATAIGEEDAGYEIGPVYEAVADYYVATGRTGRALRLLEEACDEARTLRYYVQWQGLTIELVELYRRLGMVDHARDRIAPVLRLLERFGYSLATPPTKPGRDQVIFLQLHAARLAVHPESYVDAGDLRRLYDVFAASSKSAVEAWGWSPDRGFGFMGLSVEFGVRLAELGDVEGARSVRRGIRARHARNRDTDPFVLANERGLDWSQSRLGRDLHTVLGEPFAAKFQPIADRIGARPPADRRFLARGPFVEAIALARIDLAIGEAESAFAEANRAQQRLAELKAFYAQSNASLAIADRLPHAVRGLTRLRASILEALSRDREAEALYEDYVRWSERERDSLPVEQRIHFFRGQARLAYHGAIRTRLRRYLEGSDPIDFDAVLQKAERMRSRGFQDLVGVDGREVEPVSLARLRARLAPGAGLLQLIDLGEEVATVFVSGDAIRAQLVRKGPGFRREIFRLRNRLAVDHVYDADGFDRLGGDLIGFLATELESVDRLYVTLDGTLSALPPSILPYAPGRLLHDRVTVTLIPALALWLEPSSRARSSAEPTALVVADPVFEATGRGAERAEPAALATRGDASLAYFEPLPETADEARSILESLGGAGQGVLLLGDAAKESTVKSVPDLARFSHLHFATHGVIGGDLPGLSEPALVLGWEREEDGLLTASEIVQLDLDADLTVLSACNTGNGEYFAGEGLMGLGRAFMLAGSDQVVVSLWPVESFSTQRLMELFYERLARGEPAARSLWRAQHVLRRELDGERGSRRGIAIQGGASSGAGREPDGASPFYWSPFVLISTR